MAPLALLGLILRKPHLLFRRTPGDEKEQKDHIDDGASPPRLCDFEALPKWYQDNPYIRTAYRPVSHSYAACIHSLTYMHNETVNIYTHLGPTVGLALTLPYLQLNISRLEITAPWTDRIMLGLTPMVALITLGLSTTYHTLMNHSPLVSASCLLLDYTGILCLILASFVSGIYVGFYDSPFHRNLYWGMIFSLLGVTCFLVLHPRLQGPVYRAHRTSAFIFTALSGLAPVVHGCLYYGFSEAFWNRGVMWWLLEGLWYGVGAWFFVSRWPEKAVRRGKCDVWGSSHQIFHVCVVLGAAAHCWGVWQAWKGARGL
ncbi:HlyIII-domain-containing protein [Westerdykella ornata]|uniref:HlyIII-domain-containing protein n=1 Tax=Westerdykella ornata TaxID=318751 RepID=A0A6A6JF27_WESOR|nr:HlyIII-domain-containing protein [Westerdykella ornata]KAF2274588.1 HlyIII-domain-containing protein [Westerdykella ornata]